MSTMIVFTEKDYNGYAVHFAATQNAPGDWRGHYQVHKDREKLVGATIANSYDTRALAEAKALEIGMERVDAILAILDKG